MVPVGPKLQGLNGGEGALFLAITKLKRGLREYPNLESKFVNK